MKVVIVDPYGQPVPIEDDGTFVLEEARHYRVQAMGASRARLDVRQLASPGPGSFVLPIDHWIGSAQLHLEAADGSFAARVRVRPRSEKMSETLWGSLLEELEVWLPSVTPGLAGGKQGAVGSEGVGATLFAEALLPLLPALEDALRVVLGNPRVADRIELQDRPFRQIRRVEGSTLMWLGRHPSSGMWVNAWRAADQVGAPPLVPSTVVDATLDHPANRHIAWILQTAVHRLREAADVFARWAKRPDDIGAWCAARADHARTGADRLASLRDRSFLRRLTPAPATEAALLVIADDIAYARLHGLGRRFCSPRFRIHGAPADPGAAVRPSYSLYEVWCLLAVQRSLRSTLLDWTWSSRGTKHLLNLGSTGEGIRFDAEGPNGAHLGIEFNPTFHGWFHHPRRPRFSLSSKRRPDLVITADTPGRSGRWIVLDAKYRAGRQNITEAFESLHIYRDSLRDEQRGGACLGGLLLVPQADDKIRDWFAPSWRTTWGIGAVALAPGSTSDELVRWILATLGVSQP